MECNSPEILHAIYIYAQAIFRLQCLINSVRENIIFLTINAEYFNIHVGKIIWTLTPAIYLKNLILELEATYKI